MWNAGLDEAQAGIKIAGRNINNLRYADDITLMAESKEELKSPLHCKEIQPVHPKENQSWIFIGRTDVEAETPVIWPPEVKSWLIWKDPDVQKDWRWKKRTTEDEVVGWHHWLYGHEFE